MSDFLCRWQVALAPLPCVLPAAAFLAAPRHPAERAGLPLAQVPVMVDWRGRDGAAPRLRRIRRQQRVANRVVVVALLPDRADALRRHGGVGACLDEGRQVMAITSRGCTLIKLQAPMAGYT